MTDAIQPCRFCGSHSVRVFERMVVASSDPHKLEDPVTSRVQCEDCGAEASLLVWTRPRLPFNEAAEREQFEIEMVDVFKEWRARGNLAEDNGCPASREALCWRTEDGAYGVLSLNMAWTGWTRRAKR